MPQHSIRSGTLFRGRASRTPAVFLFLFVVFSVSLYSQIYPFRSYTTSDGLVHSSVTAIYQDSAGFYLIGTSAGLSYYDGVAFHNLLDHGTNLSFVKSILEMAKTLFWVATEGNGIAEIRQGKVVGWMRKSDGVLPSDSVYALMRDPQGNIWIGTSEGIVVLRPDGGRQLLSTSNGLQGRRIRAIARQANGAMWVASTAGAMWFRYSSSGLADPHAVVFHASLALLPTRDGGMAVGTAEGHGGREGLVLKVGVDGTADTLLDVRKAGGALKVLSLLEDRSGALWIGAIPGVFRIDHKGSPKYIGKENGLGASQVASLLEDRVGNIWIGGAGLHKLPIRSFRHFSLSDRFTGSILRFGLAASDGAIWLGGFGRLTRKSRNGGFVEFPPPSGRLAWNVQSIAEDRGGRIWIAALGGLMQFKGGKVVPADVGGYRHGRFVERIYSDPSGDVWIGSEGLLYRIRGNRVIRRYGRRDGIPDDNILSITKTPDGSIWFGTNASGAGRLEGETARMITTSDGLPSNQVIRLFVDSDSLLWFGTQEGLAVWEEGSVRTRIDLNRMLGGTPVIYDIAQDSRRHYWLATRRGIVEWDGRRLRRYDSRDGLPTDIVHCGFFDEAGNLWVGSEGGPAVASETILHAELPVPHVSVLIRSGKKDAALLSAAGEYPYDENSLTLELRATDFVDEGNVEFEWRMAGEGESWQTDIGPHTIRYPLLPAGTYRLEVRARNRNGLWSPTATYAFTILPPFWLQWWFFAGVSLMVVMILWMAYRYRVRHLLEVERLRLRIAGDLHDEIGSYLGGIALESQMTQRKAGVTEEIKIRLAAITSMAHRTAEAMRDMVWLVNPEHDSLATLAVKMKDVAGQLADSAVVSFHGPQGHDDTALDLEFKRHVFLIYKEALYNAVRHSGATAIDIGIERNEKSILLFVHDNGRGFDQAAVTPGNGIRNIRNRALQIGADLTIDTRPGDGTTLTIHAPL